MHTHTHRTHLHNLFSPVAVVDVKVHNRNTLDTVASVPVEGMHGSNRDGVENTETA